MRRRVDVVVSNRDVGERGFLILQTFCGTAGSGWVKVEGDDGAAGGSEMTATNNCSNDTTFA